MFDLLSRNFGGAGLLQFIRKRTPAHHLPYESRRIVPGPRVCFQSKIVPAQDLFARCNPNFNLKSL